MTDALPDDLRTRIEAAAADHGGPRGAMLDALRAVTQAEGWVSDARLGQIAELLGVTTAELDGVASYYSLIFRRPVGETVILLCDGGPCWLNGADDVRDALMDRLGIGWGQTTPDGKYTLINVACLGACDRAPAAAVGQDRRPVGPICARDLSVLLDAVPPEDPA